MLSENIGINHAQNQNSDGSDGSDGILHNINYPPKCYYCDEYFDSVGQEVYENHVITKHRSKPCYPAEADFEFYNIKPQGMHWEKPKVQGGSS